MRLTRFAAPLIFNGLLLFIGSQTDRVLVARHLGLTELGHYSAVLLLIYYPTGSITHFLAAVHLPRVAASRDHPLALEHEADALGGRTLLLALSMMVGFAIVAPPMVTILYGGKFTQPALIVALVGILQTARFLRPWPTTVAMALGRTDIVLADNVARLVSLPAAVVGILWIGGLAGVALGFTFGELVALSTAMLLVNRATGARLLHGFERVATFVLASAVVVSWIVELHSPRGIALLSLTIATIPLIAWIGWRERGTLTEVTIIANGLVWRRAEARRPT
jgi:O-antigen/teichoic acid export membrane protein